MIRFKWWQFAIVIAVSVGFVVALFTVAEIGRARLGAAASDVRRAQLQWSRVVDMQHVLLSAESAHRAFMLTGDRLYLEPLDAAGGRIRTLAEALEVTYQGRDERVGAAIRQLKTVAAERLEQMRAAALLYDQQGAAAGLALANSASRQEAMSRFRELAEITRDYERGLVDASLARWDRELAVVRRLNVATLIVGLLLAALAVNAMFRGMRMRQDAATDLARQRDELQAQAEAQTAELSQLHWHLQHAQEEERARLSRGLHDELGGVLLAARMNVTWMQQHPTPGAGEFPERLQRVREALDQGIDLKRRVVEELRPTLLDTMGLVAALRWQVEESCKLADLEFRQQFPDDEPPFNRAAAITLFRVVQEALANVVKHARASYVDVALAFADDDVVLTIKDDGVGSTRDALIRPKAHGIAGMRHRVSVLGGRLDIATHPGGGTRIRVQVPIATVMQPAGADSASSGNFAAIPWALPDRSTAAVS